MNIASMVSSELWETKSCIVRLGNLCYKMCFLSWQSCHMKRIYRKRQAVFTCCGSFRYTTNSPWMRTMQFFISTEEGKKNIYQTLSWNENTSCVSVIFLQHPDECSSDSASWDCTRIRLFGPKNGKHGSKPHISHGPSYFLLGTYTRCKRKRMTWRLFFVYQFFLCKGWCVLLYGTLW